MMLRLPISCKASFTRFHFTTLSTSNFLKTWWHLSWRVGKTPSSSISSTTSSSMSKLRANLFQSLPTFWDIHNRISDDNSKSCSSFKFSKRKFQIIYQLNKIKCWELIKLLSNIQKTLVLITIFKEKKFSTVVFSFLSCTSLVNAIQLSLANITNLNICIHFFEFPVYVQTTSKMSNSPISMM